MIQESKSDICLLQETHSSPITAGIWEREWGGTVIFNHSTQNSRGVAVLFARNLSPSILTKVTDCEGCFLGLEVEINNCNLSVCSIYAPTQDKPREQLSFLNGIQELIDEVSGPDLILGGDLNCTLNRKLDKNTPESGMDHEGATLQRPSRDLQSGLHLGTAQI